MYSEEVKEHFKNPKNQGEMENPDAVGKAGNIMCGDIMKLYIKVEDEKIRNIKFETLGCAAAIATSSIVTELAKGKSLEDAIEIESEEVTESLEGLPKVKMHCSLLAIDALKEAIYQYLKGEDKEIPEELEEAHGKVEETKEDISKRIK